MLMLIQMLLHRMTGFMNLQYIYTEKEIFGLKNMEFTENTIRLKALRIYQIMFLGNLKKEILIHCQI